MATAIIEIPEEILTGMDAFADFTNKMLGLAGAACDIFNTLIALLGDAIRKALAIAEAAIAAIIGIIGALIAAAKNFIMSIIDFISGIIGEIFAVLSALMDEMKKLLGKIVLSLTAGSCGVIAEIVIGVPAGIVSSFDAANNFLKGDPLYELKRGVENYASKAADLADSIATAANESLDTLKGAIGSLGISL